MKSKVFWAMLFIVILGTVLRLIFIDKPDGLWNDEYVSWAIASIPFGKDFFDGIWAQCHMPLYYFYLKFFIHFWGNSDLMLRLTSVPPGVLSIISMYFLGKEFKDKKLGILCATLTALSSFLIYFSQEVRFYQLLFLFSSMMALYTVKLAKEQTKSNLFGYISTSFFVIITHTIGFVFVILNTIFLSKLLVKNNSELKSAIKKGWIIIGIILIACVPIMIKTATAHPYSQWWGHFNISQLGFLFTDYFSPVLTNIVSAPNCFFYNCSFGFIIFALIPTIIAIAGLINAVKTKNSEIFMLLKIVMSFIFVLIILAITGKLMFITKYSIEIYPILILIVAFGFLEFNNIWRKVLIFMFIALNFIYVYFDNHSAPRLRRPEGHKIVAKLLTNADLNKGDLIVLNYYPKDRFEKYFDFKNYEVISLNKGTFRDYIKLNDKFSANKIDKNYFNKKFEQNILSKLKPGQKLVLVVLQDVTMYSPIQIEEISKDPKKFAQTPYFFYIFSFIKNQSVQECLDHLEITRIENKGSWSTVTFENSKYFPQH